jgi:opacity protein-like surface antigen
MKAVRLLSVAAVCLATLAAPAAARVLNRIWFHQNANGSGWADRFRGRRNFPLTGRDQRPGTVQISASTAAC